MVPPRQHQKDKQAHINFKSKMKWNEKIKEDFIYIMHNFSSLFFI